MNNLTNDQVRELKWEDADFSGYYWDSHFSKPTLVILIKPADSSLQELVCNWATKLKLQIDYKNNVGSLLTWEVVFKSLPNSTWKVCFDFLGHGLIEFECNKLSIRLANDATIT